jgi:hypothetical protein
VAVNKNDILTNSFFVEYDEEHRHLCVYTINSGVKADVPIRLRMDALLEKGKDHATQWFGESIFLLVPSLRRELYGLDGEASE